MATEQEIEEAKAASLKWCNKQRQLKGMEPLTELPKGRRQDPISCPCGKATGLYVSSMCAYHPIVDNDGITSGKMIDWLPPLVSRFVVLFDHRLIPELIDE